MLQNRRYRNVTNVTQVDTVNGENMTAVIYQISLDQKITTKDDRTQNFTNSRKKLVVTDIKTTNF